MASIHDVDSTRTELPRILLYDDGVNWTAYRENLDPHQAVEVRRHLSMQLHCSLSNDRRCKCACLYAIIRRRLLFVDGGKL